jgi:hypothetical protein
LTLWVGFFFGYVFGWGWRSAVDAGERIIEALLKRRRRHMSTDDSDREERPADAPLQR